MNCLQCRRALDLSTNANGFAANCEPCGIDYMSLGRLMKLSDAALTSRIWELIRSGSGKTASEWKRVGGCPRCGKPMVAVPFRHAGEEHGLLACSDCHSVAMKGPTLALFREANAETQAKRLAEARALAHAKLRSELDRDVEAAKRLIRAGVDRADYLLNETPLREVRVTVVASAAAALLAVFTTLMPFTALEVFGGAGASVLLAAFTHVTFFHLAWNLLFFLPLGADAERELGSVRYAAVFGAILVVANGCGRILSPIPEAPMIGLSPLVAALLGRALVLGLPLRIRGFRVGAPAAALVFFVSELRTMIPTSGGMRWFTLGACVAAAVFAAAATEWTRRRAAPAGARPAGANVVALRGRNEPAKAAPKPPAKRAA